MKHFITRTCVAGPLAGCAVGPNYKRPQVALPGEFRGAPRGAADPAASLADTKWQDLFPDQTLNQMVDDRAEPQLRSAHRRRACGAGARATRHHPRRPVSRSWTRRPVSRDAQLTIGSIRLLRRARSSTFLHHARRGALLGTRYLGTPAPPDRGRARAYLASRGRRARGARLAGLRRDGDLLPTAGAGSGTGDQPQDAGHRQGQPEAGGTAPAARRGLRARCPAGGATAVHRHRADRRRGAQHRADRESAQPAAGRRPAAQPRGRKLEEIPSPRSCRPDCPPRCWSAVPISARPSRTWSPPTREIGAARALYFPQISLTALCRRAEPLAAGPRHRPGAQSTASRPAALQSDLPRRTDSQSGALHRSAAARTADRVPALHLFRAARSLRRAGQFRPPARAAQSAGKAGATRWKRRCGSPTCAIAAGSTATSRCWTRSAISSAGQLALAQLGCRSGFPWCSSIGRWAAAGAKCRPAVRWRDASQTEAPHSLPQLIDVSAVS